MENEAKITINGEPCTDAMAATIRCAIENFTVDLHHDGLGDDEHGKAMTKAYLARVNDIRALIYQPRK